MQRHDRTEQQVSEAAADGHEAPARPGAAPAANTPDWEDAWSGAMPATEGAQDAVINEILGAAERTDIDDFLAGQRSEGQGE
jgi:hypothetical protein